MMGYASDQPHCDRTHRACSNQHDLLAGRLR